MRYWNLGLYQLFAGASHPETMSGFYRETMGRLLEYGEQLSEKGSGTIAPIRRTKRSNPIGFDLFSIAQGCVRKTNETWARVPLGARVFSIVQGNVYAIGKKESVDITESL